MHSKTVRAGRKRPIGPVGLRNGQTGAFVARINHQVGVIGGSRPDKRGLQGHFHLPVGGINHLQKGHLIADEIRRDVKIIHIGQRGVGEQNGPGTIGQVMDQSVIIVISPITGAQPGQPVRVITIGGGRPIGRIAVRGDIVVAIRRVGRGGIGHEVWAKAIAIRVGPDHVHFQRESGPGDRSVQPGRGQHQAGQPRQPTALQPSVWPTQVRTVSGDQGERTPGVWREESRQTVPKVVHKLPFAGCTAGPPAHGTPSQCLPMVYKRF